MIYKKSIEANSSFCSVGSINMKLREQRESKLTMASSFFFSSHIFSVNKEFGSMRKYCKWDQNLAEEVGKVQNKWWTILHQKSRMVKENNTLFISNITQHNKSCYSFPYFFFFWPYYCLWFEFSESQTPN